MNHSYEIKHEDIWLRPITQIDLENMRAWRNSTDVRPFFIDSSIISTEQQKKWFEIYLKTENDIMFIVEHNNTDIGMVGLYQINMEEKTAEFGRLIIGEATFRNKGLGEKIVRGICEFGFKKLNLVQITLEVLIDNQRALRIYEAIGFIHQEKKVVAEKSLIKMKLKKENYN